MRYKVTLFMMFILLVPGHGWSEDTARDAQSIVRDAWEYYRGESSRIEVEMTIHRSSWERVLTLKAWTRGLDDSVFFIVDPPKDKGNGTLTRGTEIWTYNPKINRVIKLPPSMMSQSWMGSDFSNNDLSKANSVLHDYTHEIVSREEHEGHTVYVIKAVAKPEAPVVWGSQILKIRDDNIILQESFFDEDGLLVKEMKGSQLEKAGDKLFPKIWIMRKAESEDEYTKLHYKETVFDVDIPNNYFSVSFLKSGRHY